MTKFFFLANLKANYNYWTSGTWKGAPPNQFSWCKPSGPSVLAGDLVWEAGQPDNAGSNESCVHFRFVLNSTGTIMTDRNCANKYIYACKVFNVIEFLKSCSRGKFRVPEVQPQNRVLLRVRLNASEM